MNVYDLQWLNLDFSIALISVLLFFAMEKSSLSNLKNDIYIYISGRVVPVLLESK